MVKRTAAVKSAPQFSKTRGFPIVGIGASAGGLEAITQLLTSLPSDTGMGFVLVQHLDPKHESLSAEIFSRVTTMKVVEAEDGMPVQPNCVYLLPPNFSMRIVHGVLNLLPRAEVRGQHLVIDFFLKSLAADLKTRAVGVILSGTGSDGTQGVAAIKAEGGITFAQTPESAKFDGMPLSAAAFGAVDLCLDPQHIAAELSRIAHHPYVKYVSTDLHKPGLHSKSDASRPVSDEHLSHIFLILRNQCHVDFSLYKTSTMRRRIERRMVLHKVQDLNDYAKILMNRPDEVSALFSDLLINVTNFFRDPDSFQVLKEVVFPKLMAGRPPGSAIRIWSPGCASGEEVYSLAICLLEFLGEAASKTPIQIFGTDVSEQAIKKARAGEYLEAIAQEVSQERLSRFFIRTEGGGYKIAKFIRELCLFSRHDVTIDPPFAKVDLISCRNLLIYFTPALQKHVIPIFHYALCPKGFLWLGSAESIGGFSNLLSLIDKKNNIYTRKNGPTPLNLSFPSSTYVPVLQGVARDSEPASNSVVNIQEVVEKALQRQFPGGSYR